MPNLPKLSSRAWLVVALLWLVAMLNYLDRLMITTMHDPIVNSLAINEAQFGMLTTVFLWVYAVLSPFGGFLADRFSRRAVILSSLLVWSSVTWLTGHAQSFEQLLAARALMGISEACYIPAALALIADYHPGPTRSLATGLHMSGVYAGSALGGIGGYFAEYFGWRQGFACFGMIGIAYAVVLRFCLFDAPRDITTKHLEAEAKAPRIAVTKALAALFGQPSFWLLLVAVAIVGVANWGIYGWLPTYLKEHFHLGLGAAGISATGYIQVASFTGVLVGGAWADRWGRRNRRARALVPAWGFCLASPCLFVAASTNQLPVAIAGLAVFGLARGFFDANLMPALRQVTDERVSATGYGFLNFISCATGGLMVLAGGMSKDASLGLGYVFQASAAGLLLAALAMAAVRVRQDS